ncbi:MAG: tetratricopeptide repeat protein [Bacteroidota bacterium]
MKHFLGICFCLLASGSFANQNIDSLQNALETATGRAKVDILNKIYIAYIESEPTRALEYSKDALELATLIDYQKGRAAALNNVGVVYKNQGVYDKALDNYIESIRISTNLDDKLLLASTMNNIGTVYSLKETYDKALIYYIESYETFVKLDRKEQMIGALNNIGNAYNDMGDEDKAMEYFDRAIELTKQIGKDPSFDPLNNLGNIYFYKDSFVQALSYYKRSLEIAIKENNFRGRAYAYANIGSVHLELKKYDSATAYFDKAMSIAIDLKENPILKQVYQGIATIAFDQEDYKKAYEARLLYDKVKDYVYNEESSRKLARLEMAYEFQQKEKELEILKRNQEIIDLKLKNNRIVILLGLMGTIILIAIVFILVKLRRVKKVSIG